MAFSALPRPDMPARQPVEVTKVSSLPPTGKQAARFLRGRSGETGDQLFKFAMVLCGLAVLAMLGLIVYELVLRSGPSWHAFGFKFFAGHDWDPVNEQFGAMPFVYGTLVSSLLALLIAVPLSIGVAVFTTEMCPAVLRGPLSFFVELLAAIPSVVYGLWAIFVLIPILTKSFGPFLARTLGCTGLFQGPFYGVRMLAAGIQTGDRVWSASVPGADWGQRCGELPGVDGCRGRAWEGQCLKPPGFPHRKLRCVFRCGAASPTT